MQNIDMSHLLNESNIEITEMTISATDPLILINRKIKSLNMRLLRIKWNKENPNRRDEINQKSRDYYAKTAKAQIASSTKWNKINNIQRNATRRKLYAKTHQTITVR